MSNKIKRIAFIGGGNMAEAILAGLLRQKTLQPQEALVCEPRDERREELRQRYGVEVSSDNRDAPRMAETVILAIKPYQLDDVKDELRPILREDHLLISILAGTSRAKLGVALGREERMTRVMPNLPALVGKGVSAITFPPDLGEKERAWVRTILGGVGVTVEVEEALQDAVTAISGSGPGYLFEIARCLIQAAEAEGIPSDTARFLVQYTMIGAAETLASFDEPPEALVRKVATPGGTTEAGLKVFEARRLADIVHETVRSAAARSRELN